MENGRKNRVRGYMWWGDEVSESVAKVAEDVETNDSTFVCQMQFGGGAVMREPSCSIPT
jgi:hypothetical protein